MYKLKYQSKKELIDILESRGMSVSKPDILDIMNYSHLVYKYGSYYLDENIKERVQYRTGTDIAQLYNLYLFNAELSSKLFNIFNKIEHSIRSSIVKHISKDDPIGYFNPEFYTWVGKNVEKVKKEKEKFIKTLVITEKKKRNKYDKRNLIKGYLPIWLLIDEVPIGQLRMFMKLCGINKEVLSDIKIASRSKYLINVFNIYRNDCAHMEILRGQSGNSTFADLLAYIRVVYSDEYSQIKKFLSNYDFKPIGLDKKEYLEALGF